MISKHFVSLFGQTLINGVLPILLVIQLRYVHKRISLKLLPGGLYTLLILSGVILLVIYLEALEFIR